MNDFFVGGAKGGESSGKLSLSVLHEIVRAKSQSTFHGLCFARLLVDIVTKASRLSEFLKHLNGFGKGSESMVDCISPLLARSIAPDYHAT